MDLWETRALPILRYIADHEGDQKPLIEIGELADETGIAANLVAVEVDRLIEGNYIPGPLTKWSENDSRRWFLGRARLTERGARALSLWPKAEELLQVLEARASDEHDPGRKKALTALARAAKEVGVPMITEILSAAAKRTLGIP
jgi:DNA-binding MarR family transcriptional regulator